MRWLTILLLFVLCGCQNGSKSAMRFQVGEKGVLGDIADANGMGIVELTGRAAEEVAEKLAAAAAANMSTAESRMAEMFKYSGLIWALLVVCFLGGCVFWWFSQSRWGFILPTAAVAAAAFQLLALAVAESALAWGKWVVFGVVVLGLSVIVWKAIEYQRERNIAVLKNGK